MGLIHSIKTVARIDGVIHAAKALAHIGVITTFHRGSIYAESQAD